MAQHRVSILYGLVIIILLCKVDILYAQSPEVSQNTANPFAVGNTYGLPVLFLHGFCGTPAPWAPIETEIANDLNAFFPSLYTSGNILNVYFERPSSSLTSNNVWFQDQADRPNFFLSISPANRFFSVAFYDGTGSDVRKFDLIAASNISIIDKADELARIIWRIKSLTGTPRVILVAHSMGGLVARAYMEGLATTASNLIDPYENDVALLITLDTPHNGTPDANYSIDFNGCVPLPSIDKTEMIPGGLFLSTLNGDSFVTKLSKEVTHITSFVTSSRIGTDDLVDTASQDITQTLNTTLNGTLEAKINVLSLLDVELHPLDCFINDPLHGLFHFELVHHLPCLSDQKPITNEIRDGVRERARLLQTLDTTPSSESVEIGSTDAIAFTARFQGIPVNIIWGILEGKDGGSISPDGIYTAPGHVGTFHAVATNTADSSQIGIVTINVFSQPASNIPKITGLQPSTPAAFSKDQPITFAGQQLVCPLTITLCLGGTCFRPLSGTQIICGNTNTQVNALATLGQSGHWTAQVNTDAGTSDLFAFDVLAPKVDTPPIIRTTELPTANIAQAYTAQLIAENGATPLTWTSSDFHIPGLFFTANGTISGVPSSPGDFSFTAAVSDINQSTDHRVLTMHVSFAPINDFQLFIIGSANGSASLGNNISFQIGTATSSGTSQQISLSMTSPVSGITGTFSPNVIMSSATSQLIVTVNPNTPVGTYQIMISGTGESKTHSTFITVTVIKPAATISGFTFTPSTVVGGIGSTATITLSAAAPVGGATVNLSPSGNSGPVHNIPVAVFISEGGTTGTFTVGTDSVNTTSAGSITATYSGSTQAASLTVTPPSPADTVSIAVTPHFQTISPGNSATYQINTSFTGHAQMLTFDVQGLLPNPSIVSVSPASVLAGNSATLTIQTDVKTPLGTYNPNIGATAPNGQNARTSAILFLQTAKISFLDFNPNPIIGGQATKGTVSLIGTAPPGGALIQLGTDNPTLASVPPSVTIPEGLSSVDFQIQTTAVADRQLAQPFAMYLGSKAGSNALVVNPGPEDFSFTVTPAVQSIQLGSSAQYLITTTTTLGLRHRVQLGQSLLTNNCISFAFSPSSSIMSGDSANLTVTTGGCTQIGSAQIQIMASDSQQNKSLPTPLVLTITAPAPIASLSSTNVEFGSQIVGTSSNRSLLQLTNSGLQNLAINSITTNGDFSHSTNCGSTLLPLSSCSITVTFSPIASGSRSGALQVSSNSTDSPAMVSLNGTGVGGLSFVPVTPCRIADTRNPNGPFGGPFLSGGTTRGFTIPDSSCGIPSTAQAYSINVTVVPKAKLAFLTMSPCGQKLPLASTLNSDGRIKAAAAIVPAGTSGSVCAFVTDDTEFIMDIEGYFVPASNTSALAFYPLTPCRLVDTRGATGALGGPSLIGGAARTFPIGSSSCNVPATAHAYSLNFTSVPRGPLGFLTTWPAGQVQPLVSTLNAPTGAVTANAAIVPTGTNGDISVFVTNDSDLVIDINGYFGTPGPGGLLLYSLSPCRVLDTRNPSGTPPFSGAIDVNVSASNCNAPAFAQSYVLNATVVPQGPLGFLTLWPQSTSQPLVSTLNAGDGAITSNMAIVPTTNGSISAFAADLTHLVLDISGFFAP